jgi:hypothetical protein
MTTIYDPEDQAEGRRIMREQASSNLDHARAQAKKAATLAVDLGAP